MRRVAWTSTVAGFLCLTWGLAGAAERDTYQNAKDAAAESKAKAVAAKRKNRGPWWWPFGSFAKSEPKALAQAQKRPAPEKAVQARPIVAPLGLEGANLIAEEQAKFLRRQQVCDRIREVAQGKGDSSLEKQAQLLEQRAWFIYEQRTAQARMPSLLPIEDSLEARKLTTNTSAKPGRINPGSVHSIYARNPGMKSGGEE